MSEEIKKDPPPKSERFHYTEDNPQPPPSPLLAEYMRTHNIDKSMPFDEAKKWFDDLRESLHRKMQTRG